MESILNDKHFGDLIVDEKKMVSYFEYPHGVLKMKGIVENYSGTCTVKQV